MSVECYSVSIAEYNVLFCSQNADYTNHQIADLSEKLEQAESQVRNKVIYWLFRFLSFKQVLHVPGGENK